MRLVFLECNLGTTYTERSTCVSVLNWFVPVVQIPYDTLCDSTSIFVKSRSKRIFCYIKHSHCLTSKPYLGYFPMIILDLQSCCELHSAHNSDHFYISTRNVDQTFVIHGNWWKFPKIWEGLRFFIRIEDSMNTPSPQKVVLLCFWGKKRGPVE